MNKQQKEYAKKQRGMTMMKRRQKRSNKGVEEEAKQEGPANTWDQYCRAVGSLEPLPNPFVLSNKHIVTSLSNTSSQCRVYGTHCPMPTQSPDWPMLALGCQKKSHCPMPFRDPCVAPHTVSRCEKNTVTSL